MKSLQAIFLFGVLALIYCAFRAYPPFSANLLLVVVFAACLAAGGALFTADKAQHANAKYFFASVLPWLLAGLFLTNVALDRSKEVRYQPDRRLQKFTRTPIWAANGMPTVVPGPKKSPRPPAGTSN